MRADHVVKSTKSRLCAVLRTYLEHCTDVENTPARLVKVIIWGFSLRAREAKRGIVGSMAPKFF